VTAAISVSGVTKRFRIPLDRSTTLKYRFTHLRSSGRFYDLYALRNVSFDVASGEFLGVIGQNGCGKSTLLKILSRIYVPTSGTVNVTGRISSFLELGVGFNPELTARENVFLNGAILGLRHDELRARLDSIIDFADLRDHVDQKLKNFSSGMQVRLAFSVAIQARAQTLLMDEVLAVGDARFQEKCFDVFWQYKREGKTIVLVTHDLNAVENYCDRVILLDRGQIAAHGPAAEVTAKYRRLIGETFSEKTSPDDDAIGGEATADQRWGSREVMITQVRLLGGDGQTVAAVRSGSMVALEIEFETRTDVDEVVCGMALHRADGLHLAGSNTRLGGLRVKPPARGQRGHVTYVIDKLSLHAGSYLLSASVYDKHTQHAYDEIRMAYPLRVTEDVASHGLVELGGRWLQS